MEQRENSRKGKHLTREERMVIERMSRVPANCRGAATTSITGFRMLS